MAKKENTKIVVENEKAEEEVRRITKKREEEPKEEVKVVQVESKPPQKRVKVRLKKDHKCNIGGEWYVFKEGVRQDVPENVKNILGRADLLLPL